jgi:hypothetical protein
MATATRPGLIIPMRTYRGLNDREHPMSRHRRVRREKDEVWAELRMYSGRHGKPAIPCSVLLTRLGPSPGLDDDNLVGALKATRDAIAVWLGVNDRDHMTVRYLYAQAWAPAWGVRIEFGEPAPDTPYVLDLTAK